MRDLELGNRRFSLEIRVPSEFRAVQVSGRLTGVTPDECDLATAALRDFEAAARLGMFADRGQSVAESSAEILAIGRNESPFRFDVRLRGQHPLVWRVLLNVLCQTLASNAGDVVDIVLEGGTDTDRGYLTEDDVMRMEYAEFYDRYPFEVVFSSPNGVPRDPVLRLTFREPVSNESYSNVARALRVCDAILAHGAYVDPSDQLMPLTPTAPEIYLITPTVVEHPIFGLTQSPACFSGVCGVIHEAGATSQRIRAVEVQ